MTAEHDGANEHVECHDEAVCPLILLSEHEGFRRTFVQLAAQQDRHQDDIAELLADGS